MFYKILFFVFLSTVSFAQFSNTGLKISPIVGFSMHNQHGLVSVKTGTPSYMMTSPSVGLNVYYGNSPISFSMKKELSLDLSRVGPPRSLSSTFFGQKWLDNYYLLRYVFENGFRPELGYFRMKWENRNGFLSGNGPNIINGIVVGVSKKYNNIDVELKSKVMLDPIFNAIFGLGLYSLSFNYEFNSPNKLDMKHMKRFELRGLIGARFFPITNIRVLTAESFGKIGVSSAFGIELLHKKSNLSLNFEKDIWVAVNAGSYERELKGLIQTTSLGFKYHHKLRNKHFLRYGVAFTVISDYDKALSGKGSQFYEAKGATTSISYDIFNRTDLELKNTFIIKGIEESVFNPLRLSLGVIYRL